VLSFASAAASEDENIIANATPCKIECDFTIVLSFAPRE